MRLYLKVPAFYHQCILHNLEQFIYLRLFYYRFNSVPIVITKPIISRISQYDIKELKGEDGIKTDNNDCIEYDLPVNVEGYCDNKSIDHFHSKDGILEKRIKELQENEQQYILTLTQGVDEYMSVLLKKNLPVSLKGQKYNLFGNIEHILNFHKENFLPALMGCGFDAEKIGNTFYEYLTVIIYNILLNIIIQH